MFVCLIVFNATLNNISVISWRSVLMVEEIRGPGENHRSVASHWQTLSLRSDRDSNSQHQWWYALNTQVVINPTAIRSRPSRPSKGYLNSYTLPHSSVTSYIPFLHTYDSYIPYILLHLLRIAGTQYILHHYC